MVFGIADDNLLAIGADTDAMGSIQASAGRGSAIATVPAV
jgi:hypothetical protein